MKKTLRFAALVGALGLSLLGSKPAEALPKICLFNSCYDGKPCADDVDCGCFENGSLAGICTSNHTCVCR
jgi:hypothetical protein